MVVVVGKYWIVVIISIGNVYVWDGEGSKVNVYLFFVCVYGVKYIIGLFVGEIYLFVVVVLYVFIYFMKLFNEVFGDFKMIGEGEEFVGEDFEMEEEFRIFGFVVLKSVDEGVFSLKDLC